MRNPRFLMILYYQYFQIASVLSGLFFLRWLRIEKMLYFLLLCTVGTVVDISSIVVMHLGYTTNHFVLNYYPLLSIPLVFLAHYSHLNLSPRHRTIYISIAIATTVAGLLNFLFWEGMTRMTVLSQIFYYFFSILLSCMLLFKMAMREDYFIFTDEPVFWTSAGLLIFSLGALVVMGMSQFIRMNDLTLHNKKLYNLIMPILNVILYGSFTYSFFLCRLKKRSYSPSLS